MYKKFMMASIFSIVSIFSVSHHISAQDTPNVKLIANPNKTEVAIKAKPIALTAQSSGSGLKFSWKKLGVGELKGDLTDPMIFYVPPQEISSDADQTIVSVTVTDKNGHEATDSIVFSIVTLMSTPTPSYTPTPEIISTPTPMIQITGKPLYNMKFDKWFQWMKGNGATARFKVSGSSVSALIKESTGNNSDITVGHGQFKLQEDHQYLIRLHLSTNNEGVVYSSCWKLNGNGENYQSPTQARLEISAKGTQVIETQFLAVMSTNDAWCTIGLGELKVGTEISLHQLEIYDLSAK